MRTYYVFPYGVLWNHPACGIYSQRKKKIILQPELCKNIYLWLSKYTKIKKSICSQPNWKTIKHQIIKKNKRISVCPFLWTGAQEYSSFYKNPTKYMESTRLCTHQVSGCQLYLLPSPEDVHTKGLYSSTWLR